MTEETTDQAQSAPSEKQSFGREGNEDQPAVIAGRLTREIHNKLTGGNSGFNGPLLFPDETFV